MREAGIERKKGEREREREIDMGEGIQYTSGGVTHTRLTTN